MSTLTPEKRTALDWIEKNEKRLSDFHQEIWNYAEPALREYKSAKAYCDLLRAEGFDVAEGTGGMPTAFMATFGKGKPVLASFAEYDAVPEQSQKATPYKAPRDGLHPYAAGHTDPHSALGTACLAGILAAKEAMKKHKFKGTLKFFGEPGEKICASKPVHAAKGYYDDLDACVCYHPATPPITNSAAWDTHFGAYWSCVFTFECVQPETWPSKEIVKLGQIPRAPAALDAVCMMYLTTKSTKEAMFPNTALWTLNEFIMVGGQCTSDNLPPRFTQIQYAWRAPNLEIMEQIYRILENNARHVAEINHCKLNVRWVTKTRVGLPNYILAELAYRNMKVIGQIKYGEEARKIGREIQKHLGLKVMDKPIDENCQKIIHPSELETILRRRLPPWQMHTGADDYVEYCWHAPTVRIFTSKVYLKSPYPGYVYPRWMINALGGMRPTQDPAIFLAGKTIATSLIELLTTPAELRKARDEFNDRTGGGVGGSKWVAPLLPKDFKAPLTYAGPNTSQQNAARSGGFPHLNNPLSP